MSTGRYREDVELTHIGPGTPCGEYLRRSWHPVAFSEELKDIPIAIRVLGEYLVVFRDGTRGVGLLQPHCAHRGTSLEFGLISGCGIRCCYHGWLFDIAGRILERLGWSDRGVIMLREMLREGIRAIQAGRDFEGVAFSGSRPISTYCQDTVLRVPPAATPEGENQALIDIGRRVVDSYYVKNPPPGVVVPSYALV